MYPDVPYEHNIPHPGCDCLECLKAERDRLREALVDCKLIAMNANVNDPVWALPNKIAARVEAALAAQEEER